MSPARGIQPQAEIKTRSFIDIYRVNREICEPESHLTCVNRDT